MAFAGGNFVFPGGKLDPTDCAPENLLLARGMEAERAARILGDGEPPEPKPGPLAGRYSGAVRRGGDPALYHEGRRRARSGKSCDSGAAGGGPGRCPSTEARPRVPDARAGSAITVPGELYYLTRWITPVYFPMRFDARYFLCQVPPGQIAEPCRHEVTVARWIQPAEALGRWRAGEFKMRGPDVDDADVPGAIPGMQQPSRRRPKRQARLSIALRGMSPSSAGEPPRRQEGQETRLIFRF